MKQLLVIFAIFTSFLAFAQKNEKKEKDKVLPVANDEYSQKKYTDAEANYRISASKGISGAKASYNLGNAIYKQNYSSESKIAYLKAIETATTKEEKHKAFHNLGNVYMNEKRYDMAVEAYKNALRNNPADEQTRYNYALAKQMLKDNPPQGGGGDDKNKDKKENQDQQNKDQQKNKDNGQDQDKKDQDGNEDKKDSKPKQDEKENEGGKDKGEAKPKPGGMPQERMENILEAVNNNEKQVQEKMNLKNVKAKPRKTEKDW